MNVKTHKRSRIALHAALLAVMVVAVVVPVLLPGSSSVAIAFPEYRHSYNNTPMSFGWTVEGSSGATNPEGVLGTEVDGCAATNHTNVVDGYVTYDLGEVFLIDEVYLYADGGSITLFTSTDGSTWGEQAGRLYTSCGYGPGTDHWSVGVPGNGESVRYIKFSVFAESNWDWFVIHALSQATPTPTPLPSASPFPAQPTACVTVTPTPLATAQRTPTPFNLTPHPSTATPTPGGPTATPTPGPSFDSGLATFDQSISPWTALITSNYLLPWYFLEWRSTAGMDGRPGVVFVKDAWAVPDGTDEVISETLPFSGTLVYSKLTGLEFPLRVTGKAKWSVDVQAGDTVYLSVWYLDPDFFGPHQPAWITKRSGAIAISSVWGSFSYLITQQGGSGKITAVMIMEEVGGSGPPYPAGDGMLLDDLRVFSGPLAVAGSYPTCPGSGGSGKPPVAIKQCIIKAITVDVYAGCTVPTDTLDLIGWISYYFCRLWHYLWFVNENRAQVTDIMDRQNSNEPLGTLNEMDDVLGVLYDTVQSVGAVYEGNDYYTIDWSSLFAGWNIDLSNITEGWDAQPDPIDKQAVLNACPATIANMNPQIQKSACFVIWVLKIKLRWWIFLQYALDASSIIFALTVILDWLGKHG